MDGGGGVLSSITSWFTPTIFFCLFNLTVATIFIQSSFKPKKNNQEQQQPTRLVSDENDSVHFFRFPKLLERVKSINLSRSYQHPEPEEEPVQENELFQEHEAVEEEEERHVERTMSDTIVATLVKRKKMMRKSQSAKIVRVEEMEMEAEAVERLRPATVRERKGGVICEDEAVDAKADDFINRFKQQLKLQRLDSLLRFRGSAAN